MKYKVTISQTETTSTPKNEYQKIADTGGRDGGAAYEYVENPGVVQAITKDIYIQEVDTLDIVKVIAAVNGQ